MISALVHWLFVDQMEERLNFEKKGYVKNEVDQFLLIQEFVKK
ncbi:hypothetical protein [Effusibacillus lacus]|nr:hypothetical protein [Effusibacillus lacus]TCS72503.1 hypothetical protein EDD64_1216 [Effusibacillus lacus]